MSVSSCIARLMSEQADIANSHFPHSATSCEITGLREDIEKPHNGMYKSLPPTSASVSYHSAVCTCKCINGWGKETIWTQTNGAGYECGIAFQEPRITGLQPATEALLKVVGCSCRNDCDTRRCSCKKHGWNAHLRVVNARVSAARPRP